MKQLLLFLFAILIIASTFTYAHSPDHYPLAVVAGVIAAVLLLERSTR